MLSVLDESSFFAGNKENYNSMNEFELLPDPITNY